MSLLRRAAAILGAAAIGAGPASAMADESALNKEGFWGLEASPRPGVCTAYGVAGEHLSIMFLGVAGQVGLALDSDGALLRGRKGLVETDAFKFAFKPAYDGPGYMYADDPIDSQTMFALRRAKSLRVSVDGRALAEVNLEASGFPGMLDSLIACSQGEKGWWGEGAKPAA